MTADRVRPGSFVRPIFYCIKILSAFNSPACSFPVLQRMASEISGTTNSASCPDSCFLNGTCNMACVEYDVIFGFFLLSDFQLSSGGCGLCATLLLPARRESFLHLYFSRACRPPLIVSEIVRFISARFLTFSLLLDCPHLKSLIAFDAKSLCLSS